MTKEQLLEKYAKIEEINKEVADLRSQLKTAEKARIEALKEHRKECVCYVLDNVRSLVRSEKMTAQDIDIYLCHCQNKLNGDIDGVIVDFDKYRNAEGEHDKL